ncbi:hypothetical protein GGR51DRAFT_553222 [Nemania sp. FL0031]|nr:hypothetical protein GGR51DRAFT_553222 [Nemania sp. FL0031]
MQPPQSSTAASYSIMAIRQLFGYSDTCQLSSAHEPSNLGATLPNSSMKDVLLIGIDIDTYQGYEHLPADPQLHIGVSILDTRVLYHIIHEGLDSMRETGILESYQFVVGDSNDRKALSNLDIQLQPLYIIDNVKAAQTPLGLPYRLGLEAMLDTFVRGQLQLEKKRLLLKNLVVKSRRRKRLATRLDGPQEQKGEDKNCSPTEDVQIADMRTPATLPPFPF